METKQRAFHPRRDREVLAGTGENDPISDRERAGWRKSVDLYTAIVVITMALLLGNIVDVWTNRLAGRITTIRCITGCLAIGLALMGEWIGARTNGAGAELIGLHRFAKTVEYCMAPVMGVMAAHAYSKVRKPAAAMAALVANALFIVVSNQYGLIFYIDEANVYHRGRLYWMHAVVFILSILYCFICIVLDEMKYQMRPDAVLLVIMLFLSMGIYIQMIFPDLRVDYLCVAMGNALLYNHRCRLFSRLDGLTMLLNRIRYEKDLERIKKPAVIINMDVNDFKQINDTNGHATGDYYLRQIAEVIRTVYGRYGDCYRHGGDEFSVILTKNLHQTEKLNGMFEAALGQLREQDPQMPTVSLGYALYEGGAEALYATIEKADAMMYRNKKVDDCAEMVEMAAEI